MYRRNSKRNDSSLLSKEDSAKYDALENTVVDLGDDTFGQTIIGSYKLGTAIKVSEELLNDSAFDIPSFVLEFEPSNKVMAFSDFKYYRIADR